MRNDNPSGQNPGQLQRVERRKSNDVYSDQHSVKVAIQKAASEQKGENADEEKPDPTQIRNPSEKAQQAILEALETRPECKDLRTECQGWGEAGECKRNPGFMMKSCKQSCGLCLPSGREATQEELAQ